MIWSTLCFFPISEYFQNFLSSRNCLTDFCPLDFSSLFWGYFLTFLHNRMFQAHHVLFLLWYFLFLWWSMAPFIREFYLYINIWSLGTFIATELSLLVDYFRRQSLGGQSLYIYKIMRSYWYIRMSFNFLVFTCSIFIFHFFNSKKLGF